jgi:hypothetical protein
MAVPADPRREGPGAVANREQLRGIQLVRISTHAIRIAEPDLSAFVHRRRSDES